MLKYGVTHGSQPRPVGSRSPDGWDQISRWAGGWVLHQPPWSFGFDSQTRGTRENRRTLCSSTGFLTGPRFLPRLNCRYGEAPAASASWRRWGRRAPFSTDTASHTRLPTTHPFVLGAPILQRHFQVQWRARLPPPASSSLTHARRMDGFCNQNADQLGSLAGLSFPAVYVGVVECDARLSLHILLLHTQVSR